LAHPLALLLALEQAQKQVLRLELLEPLLLMLLAQLPESPALVQRLVLLEQLVLLLALALVLQEL
jgi:hypothetical protein